MKILALVLSRRGGTIIDHVWDLNSFGFLQRGTIKEVLLASSKIFIDRFNVNSKCSVPHEGYMAYVDCREDFGGVVYTDQEYPERVAARCLSEMMREYLNFTKGIIGGQFPQLQNILTKYANPAGIDRVGEVQNQVNEVTMVMHKNIEAALQNNAKMEDLLQQSNELSAKSKVFLKQAKKANRRCCTIQICYSLS
ncbi:synaptobrevin domain-containing protein [Heterostelium album PN500]|uniref:Synaptobrevin domain-containing protein n=1 Tax=Heterostelium pallidum (strain ATCC 26659 / Pp 5 / PN500) TaxID=670386 RepID=D3BMA2_HETP5|nr:synaptobrevin domain-containing protein [Heterostelium album PN500]EFA77703.1 synaptobrevin domain-containing protein [Heterostelium album PN500]|eukprot:XP_020429831.1 synaptobrevin domain-containing protein [Heterostelium album PN500]